jgi:hypothetical protein
MSVGVMNIQLSQSVPHAELPPPGKMVVVQSIGFRCMAYRDQNGNWKGAYDHKPVQVVAVLRDDSDGVVSASA